MDNGTSNEKPKWYHLRRLGLTGDYCAGLMAGFGLGVVVTVGMTRDYLMGSGWTLAFFPGLAMIALGSSMQRLYQRRRAGEVK